MVGVVQQIAISPIGSELPQQVASVEVLAGQGPRGDRYFVAEPEERDGDDLTLIEAEALEAFTNETGIALSHEESRRNVLTRGIRLSDLVGKRFRIGAVELEGNRLCEPCATLRDHTGVFRELVGRGGLRADVLAAGELHAGDEIEVL